MVVLSLIDRVTRTIRDIAFNLQFPITPRRMEYIVNLYNQVPHTLSI
jgi:hypothetical protein